MAEDQRDDDFMTQASQARTTLVGELVAFLRDNKKWWITPIVISILILTMIVVLGGTAAAPFIYTLF
jgi:hypothetical protein